MTETMVVLLSPWQQELKVAGGGLLQTYIEVLKQTRSASGNNANYSLQASLIF